MQFHCGRRLPTDDEPVVTMQHTLNICGVSFRYQCLRHLVTSLLVCLRDTLPQMSLSDTSTTCLVLALPG